MTTHEGPSDNTEQAPLVPSGEAQNIAAQLEATFPRDKSDGTIDTSTDPRAIPHVTGILILNEMEGRGVNAATTLRTRLSELDEKIEFPELQEVAAQYEEERVTSNDQRQQIEAQANGELARAVGGTASLVASWYVRGPSAVWSLLPVTRNLVAKVEQMEVPEQAGDYLNRLLDDIEAEVQTSRAGH
jgi:hypothetical protein